MNQVMFELQPEIIVNTATDWKEIFPPRNSTSRRRRRDGRGKHA